MSSGSLRRPDETPDRLLPLVREVTRSMDQAVDSARDMIRLMRDSLADAADGKLVWRTEIKMFGVKILEINNRMVRRKP